MKFFNCKYFSLLALACFLSASIQADRYAYDQGVECRTRCNDYECGCNPLYCGALDFQVQAGVLPITWHDRGQFSAISCGTVATNPVITLFDIPKFSRFFKLPWTIGAQFGYALSDNVRVYFEFDYSQAKRKNDVTLSTNATTPTVVAFTLGKYKLYDLYVGGRYYFDRWCERLSFFIGFKAGLVHHNRVRFSSNITSLTPVLTLTTNLELFKRNTVPSGGIDFGFDLCYCGNWSFILAGGILASCGPKSNFNIIFNPTIAGFNNLLIGDIGAELRFPVTLGVRYSF
jgi:hypothetical protein